MNLSAYFAKKYLVSKSSSQAIHWITGISILGISIGTAALIIVLSVFNGFEFLLSSLFSKHNPDIKIVREGVNYFWMMTKCCHGLNNLKILNWYQKV